MAIGSSVAGRRLVGDADDAARLAGAGRAGGRSGAWCRGARARRAARSVVVIVAACRDDGTDERHRQPDDRAAADEVAAADLASGIGLDEVEVHRTDVAPDPIECLPIHWVPPPLGWPNPSLSSREMPDHPAGGRRAALVPSQLVGSGHRRRSRRRAGSTRSSTLLGPPGTSGRPRDPDRRADRRLGRRRRRGRPVGRSAARRRRRRRLGAGHGEARRVRGGRRRSSVEHYLLSAAPLPVGPPGRRRADDVGDGVGGHPDIGADGRRRPQVVGVGCRAAAGAGRARSSADGERATARHRGDGPRRVRPRRRGADRPARRRACRGCRRWRRSRSSPITCPSPSTVPTTSTRGGRMQEAAMLAGMAIDAGGTGIAHAIGHALGTLGHVPHGVAVAAGLRAALEWNIAGGDGAYDAGGDGARLLRSPTCRHAVDELLDRLPVRRRRAPGRAADDRRRRARRDDGRRREPADARQQLPTRRRRRSAPSGASRRCGGGRSGRRERDRAHRDHPPPPAARPAVPRRVGPAAARGVPGDDRPRRRRRRARRHRLGRRDVRVRRLRALVHRRGPARPRPPPRRARQHRLPRRPAVAARRRPVGPRRADPRPARCGTWSAGGRRRCAPTPRRVCTVRSTRWARWRGAWSSSASPR